MVWLPNAPNQIIAFKLINIGNIQLLIFVKSQRYELPFIIIRDGKLGIGIVRSQHFNC